jgi:predicted transcriptional regulator
MPSATVEDTSVKNFTVVDDPKGVALLMDMENYQVIEPFFGCERSVGEVATQLNLKVNQVHYWVKRFERLGLVQRMRTEERRGRGIHYYQVPGDGLFVPFDLLQSEQRDYAAKLQNDLQDYLSALIRKAQERSIPDHRSWGIHFYRSDNSMLAVKFGPRNVLDFDSGTFYARPDILPLWSDWQKVVLTPAEAKAFQLELIQLSERFRKAHRSEEQGCQAYFIHLAIAPDPDF